MGPSAPRRRSTHEFAIPRAVPLFAKAEPIPGEFYSILSGNTARYRDQRPATNGAAESRASPPPPGPAERRAEPPTAQPLGQCPQAGPPLPASRQQRLGPPSLRPRRPGEAGRGPPVREGGVGAGGAAEGGCPEGRGPQLGAQGRAALTMSAGRVRGAVERRRLPVRPCGFDAATRPLPPPPGSEHPGQRRRPRPRAALRQSARGSPAIAKYGYDGGGAGGRGGANYATGAGGTERTAAPTAARG